MGVSGPHKRSVGPPSPLTSHPLFSFFLRPPISLPHSMMASKSKNLSRIVLSNLFAISYFVIVAIAAPIAVPVSLSVVDAITLPQESLTPSNVMIRIVDVVTNSSTTFISTATSLPLSKSRNITSEGDISPGTIAAIVVFLILFVGVIVVLFRISRRSSAPEWFIFVFNAMICTILSIGQCIVSIAKSIGNLVHGDRVPIAREHHSGNRRMFRSSMNPSPVYVSPPGASNSSAAPSRLVVEPAAETYPPMTI
ncbi:hypothetical protein OF83DRAFT_55760 [Amylostereum chailletii]|nr:hypothetical protein OF83DRAFT_55760 [Amylostereum chailletii]